MQQRANDERRVDDPLLTLERLQIYSCWLEPVCVDESIRGHRKRRGLGCFETAIALLAVKASNANDPEGGIPAGPLEMFGRFETVQICCTR